MVKKMFEIMEEIHEITTDGLPDMDDYHNIGHIAFIWDGHIISGWPTRGEEPDRWTTAEDRFGGDLAGVTHWVKCPVAFWNGHKDEGENKWRLLEER